MDIKILGVPYTLRHVTRIPWKEPAYGLCVAPHGSFPGHLSIRRGLTDPKHLSTVIHEMLHAGGPDNPERRINSLAATIARTLRTLGYHRDPPFTEPR